MWGAAIAQWIRLSLPPCCHGFKSRAHHLRFYRLWYLCCICHVKRTKINKKEAGFGPLKNPLIEVLHEGKTFVRQKLVCSVHNNYVIIIILHAFYQHWSFIKT